jgi:hypothetical protein
MRRAAQLVHACGACWMVVLVDELHASLFYDWTVTRERDMRWASDGPWHPPGCTCVMPSTPSDQHTLNAPASHTVTPFPHRYTNAAMNFCWCLISGASPPLHLRRGLLGRGDSRHRVIMLLHLGVGKRAGAAHGQALWPAGHKCLGVGPNSTRWVHANGRDRPYTVKQRVMCVRRRIRRHEQI